MSFHFNVVLSGGGSRGYAHIGALTALYEKGLKINAISATSAGALVGALICDGYHPQEIKELILKEEPKIAINLAGFSKGILSIDGFAKFIKRNLRCKNIEQLKTPLFVSVTNLVSGRQEVFKQGPILESLLAASAIPGLFAAININETPYADGGISGNLPVEPFINDSHKILGIHVNPLSDYNSKSSLTHLIDRSVHLALRRGVENNIKHCHIFIEPPGLKKYHLFENRKTAEIIETGYIYVKNNVELNP